MEMCLKILVVHRYYFLRPQINQFLESMPSLTNFIEKNNNIYEIKETPYGNIFNGKSNDTNLIP
jgi:hypothetical protein